MEISIDIVVPAVRLTIECLGPIFSLQKPEGVILNYYIVADDPHAGSSEVVILYKKIDNIHFIINKKNEGAATSRNKGIEAGNGNYLLFLDDDVIVAPDLLINYAEAIKKFPAEIGFLGLIDLPTPSTAFANAIVASGSMNIFQIAKHKDFFAWGATANSMVKRVAMGSVKFSVQYPKGGGGEDVDFFLRIRERNQFKNFKTLPEARVLHPWWHEGSPDLMRPYRYGKGNSFLGKLLPPYTYRDFLNTPETVLFCAIAFIISIFTKRHLSLIILYFTLGVMMIEIIATAVQTVKRTRKINAIIIFYVFTLRMVQETGVLVGKLSRGEFLRIGERFHDDGTRNPFTIFRTNTYKIIKWFFYPILIALCFKLYS